MRYLEYFLLPNQRTEDDYILNFKNPPPELEQSYNPDNAYPFKIFPFKGVEELTFEPITILYGGNGSGKSTILNVIAEKLRLDRASPFNRAACFTPYVERCRYRLDRRYDRVPRESRIVTSDDVFDYLLDIRAINEGLDRRREDIFEEYASYRDPTQPTFQLRSLEDYEELKRRNEARHTTKSTFTARRIPRENIGRSNGENALMYFTKQIGENALYLLDEPENSLSAAFQNELRQFLEDSARFYGCQFILATHSPFLLSMKGAKIYDLDAAPAAVRPWTELPNVRLYHDFFEAHREEFER